MVEYVRSCRVAPASHVCARLLIEPPGRQSKLISDSTRLFQNNAMRLEDSVNITCRPAPTIGHRHSRATDHINVGYDAARDKLVTKQPERFLDRRPVKKRASLAHATSSSSGATYTPRRRNAAGREPERQPERHEC